MKPGAPRVKTTKEGRRSALALLLVAVAALNTGNNLIYLIVSMMAAMLAISVIALWINLKGLKISIEGAPLPRRLRVFAGEASPLDVALENGKKRLTSYSLKLIPPRGASSFFSHIGAGGSGRATIKAYFPKRGLCRSIDGIRVESGFPFIFFSVSRPVAATGEILVYPRIVETDFGPGGLDSGFSAEALRGEPGEDMQSLREYAWGDDMRRINWKATARHDTLIVKEPLREERKAALLVLDGTGPENPAAFERAVSIAAGLARAFLERGYFLSLFTHEGQKRTIPFGEGQEQFYRVMDCLSLINEEPRYRGEMPAGGSALVLKGPGSRMAARSGGFRTVIYAGRV